MISERVPFWESATGVWRPIVGVALDSGQWPVGPGVRTGTCHLLNCQPKSAFQKRQITLATLSRRSGIPHSGRSRQLFDHLVRHYQ